MKALVLGTGGREHAVAWKLSHTLGKKNVFLHPGNPGTLAKGYPSLPGGTSPGELAQNAKAAGIDLVVIGPEAMLAIGMADVLREAGLSVVGPGQSGTRLESSKIFAKEFMSRAGVPTAKHSILESQAELEDFTVEQWPTVFKLDGLAAGKGVVVAQNSEDVQSFCRRVWVDQEFGPGPHRILVEDFLLGHEVSYMGFCDGNTFLPLATATDYKRVYDNNEGPNTGGMGSISPSPYINPELEERIDREVIQPILAQMKKDSLSFRGILYVGLMVTAEGKPQVLEFNTRFGDPETQAILMRLESPLEVILKHTAAGTLGDCEPPQWSPQVSLYVVAAAEGYPGTPRKGDPISGLDGLPEDVTLFFSGVTTQDGETRTSGGRVLGLGALGNDVEYVRQKVYSALEGVSWSGMHFRKDIGR